MRREQVFPSNYLTAFDVEEAGGKMHVTIDDVEMQKMPARDGKPAEDKPVVIWKEDVKPVVLNVTNWRACERIAGSSDSEGWVGVVVELFTAEVDAFGEVRSAIRIRKPAGNPSKRKKAKAPATPPDEGFGPPANHPANDAFGDDPGDPFS